MPRTKIQLVLFLAALAFVAAPLHAQTRTPDPLIDSPMTTDPEIVLPEAPLEFDPQLKALWLGDMSGAVVDNIRRAMDAIAAAHQMGMPNLDDAATVAAITTLLTDHEHPLVKRSAARALIALDA